MSRLILAFRAFFGVLFNLHTFLIVERAMQADGANVPIEKPVTQKPAEKPVAARQPEPNRHEALALLAAMQREARFVDFLQEPIESYTDAQIGAAVRDIHRDCRKLLDRVFALKPAITGEEGATVDVPAGFDAARYRLTGNLSGQPPLRGLLCHAGWEATRCELPVWTGAAHSARVIAPAEIEIK